MKGQPEAEGDEELDLERPTLIDVLSNETNNMNDMRIKELALELESAQSTIDIMFKVPDQN